jgi:hypothetical protein
MACGAGGAWWFLPAPSLLEWALTAALDLGTHQLARSRRPAMAWRLLFVRPRQAPRGTLPLIASTSRHTRASSIGLGNCADRSSAPAGAGTDFPPRWTSTRSFGIGWVWVS